MKWYWWLLIVLAVVAGFSTLIPMDASKECFLGYEAHCTFTPVSTGICIGLAIALMFFGGVMSRSKSWDDEE